MEPEDELSPRAASAMVAAVDHLPSLFTIASVVSLSVLKLVLCGVAAAVGFRSLRKDGTLGPSICKE